MVNSAQRDFHKVQKMPAESSFFSKLSTFFDLTLFPRIVWKNRSLVLQFVIRNITSRYRGSFLGVLWSLIQPLLMLMVYTFVFSIVFRARWGVETGGSRGAFASLGMQCFQSTQPSPGTQWRSAVPSLSCRWQTIM